MKPEPQLFKLLVSLLVTQTQSVVQNERDDDEDKAEHGYDDWSKGDK